MRFTEKVSIVLGMFLALPAASAVADCVQTSVNTYYPSANYVCYTTNYRCSMGTLSSNYYYTSTTECMPYGGVRSCIANPMSPTGYTCSGTGGGAGPAPQQQY
jgi:hypothetical protein